VNALDLLKKHHKEVKQLFKKFEKLAEDAAEERVELFAVLADRLAAHTTIEEQLFYPFIKNDDTEDIIRESLEEHLSAKRLMADLLEMEGDDANFDAKLEVLQEQVEHHVEEEEEELFKLVRKGFSDEQLEDLGERMQAEYDDLLEQEPRFQVPGETDTAAPI
jgi:hemerythrin-like domain-containing protein